MSPVAPMSLAIPPPPGTTRYFIVKSNNLENLELSAQRGMWATHRNNEGKLNEAYESCDSVILIFSVNETRHFQGCALMMSRIGAVVGGGPWKYAQRMGSYGQNFRIRWLKLCELSFNKTRHLRNQYNDNQPSRSAATARRWSLVWASSSLHFCIASQTLPCWQPHGRQRRRE
ncbi:hypothetical protein CLOP_g12929 [Closterium sp. NIES-67]|nr:hypothetical protein CLOP_g12929 [Closterium sp. NIES-67]